MGHGRKRGRSKLDSVRGRGSLDERRTTMKRDDFLKAVTAARDACTDTFTVNVTMAGAVFGYSVGKEDGLELGAGDIVLKGSDEAGQFEVTIEIEPVKMVERRGSTLTIPF
jgi:hypothetical protein